MGRRAFVSLSEFSPPIAAQWHPTRNDAPGPDGVHAGSGRSVWWKCPAGPDHEWQAPVYKRTSRGDGCPYCSNRRVSVTNSLATLHPELAAEWHPDKNGDLTPDAVVAGSSTAVWWRCRHDPAHEWTVRVVTRTQGHGCPYCARVRSTPRTSLAAVNPDAAAQWHPTKNGALGPEDVAARSMKRVWWKCPNGPDHEWQTPVDARGGQGQRCPFCQGRRLSVTNSLAALYPELAAQWHPTKNGGLSPADVLSGSNRRVWWKCPEGPDHEWSSRVIDRKLRPGCPFCRGLKASVTNSVAALHPDLAAQWHPTRNGDLTPEQVVAGSNKRVWWKCPAGPDHEWQADPNARVFSKGCPFCRGFRTSVTNSLASLCPDVAAEWHPTRNDGKTPSDVTASSGRKVWWQCRVNPRHEWAAVVSNRTGPRASGCPECQLRPESRQEILLRYELAYVFDFDPEDRKVRCGSRVYSCDVVLRADRTVVEFDGSFWHSGREEDDIAKNRRLARHGWQTVRVREAPLSPIEDTDVCVPQGIPPKCRADIVVAHLSGLLGRGDAASYVAAPEMFSAEAAEEYIRRRLENAAARKE